MDKVKMQCPEGGTGCSFNGDEFKADKNGVVEVPQEAVGQLQSHGFTLVPTKAK